jgi:endo-1,4-beta-xylanase
MTRRRFLWSILVVVLVATLLTGMPGCRSKVEPPFTPPYSYVPNAGLQKDKLPEDLSELNEWPLKDLAEVLNFHVGTAVPYNRPGTFPNNPQYVEVLTREFNAVVAENVMKWDAIRWSESSYNFAPGDAIVAFAEENGMMVRGHTLAWHSQNPGWLQGKNYTREEAIEVLEDHITKVVTHWKGKIKEWDVVNEAINDEGHRRTENVWQKWIGDDWIEIAFRAAHKADPDALLFYNDYNLEFLNSAKQNAVYNLLKKLLAKGVPIHGVGFQGHFGLEYGGAPLKETIKASIDRFAKLGLYVQFTEVDVRIQIPVNETKLQQQANSYSNIFSAALEHPACNAVLVWGIHDGHTWVDGIFPGTTAPLLFDADFNPKPAYDTVRECLIAEIERRLKAEENGQ